jgi:hypothetical protein
MSLNNGGVDPWEKNLLSISKREKKSNHSKKPDPKQCQKYYFILSTSADPDSIRSADPDPGGQKITGKK